MLARLALVIHWGIFCAAIALVVSALFLIAHDDPSLVEWASFVAICIGPPALFTILYWIVTIRWAIFPWQHIKND